MAGRPNGLAEDKVFKYAKESTMNESHSHSPPILEQVGTLTLRDESAGHVARVRSEIASNTYAPEDLPPEVLDKLVPVILVPMGSLTDEIQRRYAEATKEADDLHEHDGGGNA